MPHCCVVADPASVARVPLANALWPGMANVKQVALQGLRSRGCLPRDPTAWIPPPLARLGAWVQRPRVEGRTVGTLLASWVCWPGPPNCYLLVKQRVVAVLPAPCSK